MSNVTPIGRGHEIRQVRQAPAERVKAHNEAVLRRAKLTKPVRARIARAAAVSQRAAGLL